MGTGGKSPQELCSSSSEDVLLVDGVKTSAGGRRSKQARHGSADRPSATKSRGAANGAEKRDVEASVGADAHAQNTPQTKKTRTSTSKEEEELPPGWVKVKSRSKPGAFYYAHPATKHTQAERPVAPRLAPSTAAPPSVVGSEPQLTRRQAEGQRKAAVEQRKAADEQRKATDEQRRAAEAKQRAAQRAQEAEAEEAAREELLRRARERRAQEAAHLAKVQQQDNKPEPVEQEDSSDEEEVTLEDIAKWKEDEETLEQQAVESPNVTPPDPSVQHRGEDEEGPSMNGLGIDPWGLAAPESSLMGTSMQTPLSQPCFHVLKFGVLVETHLLGGPKQSWTVGRATEHVDITLNHVSISRQHAVVMRHGAQMLLMDLGSTHGTALNGQRLEKNRPVPLTTHCRACFGASTRVFIYFESPNMVPMSTFTAST